jgi:hypothetical protein
MRKIVFILTFIVLASVSSFAQSRFDAAPYDNAVGTTVGFMNGLKFKTFPTDHLAIQFDLGYRFMWDYMNNYVPAILSFNPNVMYESSAGYGFYWFVGGGLNIGASLPKYYYYSETDNRYMGGHCANFVFGLNAIGGVEYKFNNIPLALQVDARPGFFLFANNKYHSPYILFDYSFLNISVHYTF